MGLLRMISSLITTLAVIAIGGTNMGNLSSFPGKEKQGDPKPALFAQRNISLKGPKPKAFAGHHCLFCSPKMSRFSRAPMLYELCPLKESHAAPTLIRAIITLMGAL